MKSKDDLFHLIKAMSKSEKRYFTLDAQKSGKKGSKYLDLFQAINGMEDYDEAKLKKKFPKSLSTDKAYLYDAILRSMRDYRSSKSKAAHIKEMILDSKYLYERGLYNQCEERLKEAQELAIQLDDQLSFLEIIKGRRQLVWDLKKKNFGGELEQIIEETKGSFTSLIEEFKFLDLRDNLGTVVVKKQDLDDEQKRKELQDTFAFEELEKQSLPTNAHALHRFYQSAALYYQLLGDFDKVYEYYSKVVKWWDDNPLHKGEEFYRYVIDISNLLHAWYRKGEYQYFPELLNKIERDTPTNLHDQKIVFQKLSMYKLVYFINSGESEGVDKLVSEIDYGLKEFNINPISSLVLIFNVALVLFIHNSFEDCIAWCERIIKEYKIASRKDIQKAIQLLHLGAIYETDDFDLLENTLRSSHRYFSQSQDLGNTTFELKVIDFFKKLMNAPLGELNRIYEDFREYLIQVKKDPDIKINLSGVDELLLFWLNSKLERRTVLQVLTSQNSKAS